MQRDLRIAAAALISTGLTLAGAYPAAALCAGNPMAGNWVTTNPGTRFLTRARVTVGCCDQVLNGVPQCSPPDRVRLFGRCHPRDCDWGARTGSFMNQAGTQMNLTYDQGFARRSVRLTMSGDDNLRIRVVTDFRDSSRADYTRTEIMRRE